MKNGHSQRRTLCEKNVTLIHPRIGFKSGQSITMLWKPPAPMRERRAAFAREPGLVRDILRAGNARANTIADQTLHEVREAMGTVY